MAVIKIKRIYAPIEKTDGFRVLVDRLWPRGIRKESAHIDAWIKEVAPSTELRKWFHHQPENWQKFRDAYQAELQKSDYVGVLLAYIKQNRAVTLLYASRDVEHNHAVILKEFLDEQE